MMALLKLGLVILHKRLWAMSCMSIYLKLGHQ
ncbi:UNVERIFIED_CONTAM: hypothetical protein GTU68_018305 [Idotea baltica]|nr:hypothetical protein [Idotea baltica]